MTSPRQQRALRAGAAATLATAVALLSHVAGGGEAPAPLGVALPWALSLVVCLLLVGRRLSGLRLGLAVTAAQVLFHAMFAVGVVPLAGSAHAPGATGAAGEPRGLHSGHMSLPASVTAPGSIEQVIPDAAMIGAHLAAAFATTLMLHRGERLLTALADLARRIGRRLRAVVRGAVPPSTAPLRRRTVAVPVRSRHPRPLIAAPARRGPPILLAL